MLIFNYLLALELLWWPWQLVTLFPLSVCSSHQVLFGRVLASSTFAAVLQTGCGKIQDRDIFWDSHIVSSLLCSCSGSFPFLLGLIPSLQILVTPYHAIFAQEINPFEGIRESCCCGLPFPLLQCVNNSSGRGAAHQLRWQSGVPRFNPVTQCIVI